MSEGYSCQSARPAPGAAPLPAADGGTARIGWIDVAKTLGIYLIVYSHLDQNGFAESFLWTFHVPLFFFVSGYLARPEADRDFLARLARRLLLPYLYIYVVTVLVTTVLHADYAAGPILRSLVGVVYGTRSYPGFANDALWFLPSLITIELVYALCIRRFAPSYLLMLAVSYALYRGHRLDLFLSVDLSLLGLNYFMAGVVARRYACLRPLEGRPARAALAALAGLACTSFAASIGNVWYAGEHYAVSLGAGLAGIAMVIGVSMLVAPLLESQRRARELVTFISANTLFIFCFHVFSNPAAAALLASAELPRPLRAAAVATLSIALLVPFNLLVRRYLPALIGQRRPRR